MTPTLHASTTRALGAPANWDQEQLPVDALPITDHQVNGVPCIASFWQPDAIELDALNAGGMVMLNVVGHTMPPVLLAVTKPDQPQPNRSPSPTAGMNIAQRILHVGGRNNAAGYVEFGSIQAVEALVRQVLRDLPANTAQQLGVEPIGVVESAVHGTGGFHVRLTANVMPSVGEQIFTASQQAQHFDGHADAKDGTT